MAMSNSDLTGRFWSNVKTTEAFAKLDQARALAAGRIYRAPYASESESVAEQMPEPATTAARQLNIVLYAPPRTEPYIRRRHSNRCRKR